MPIYKYQAKNTEGEIYERTAKAPDKFALYHIIREEGGTVVLVHEVKKFYLPLSLSSIFRGVKTQDKINLAKNLSSMVEAGLSVTRALAVIGKQTKRGTLKNIISSLESDVSHGTPLSEALSKYPQVFSSLFVSMVKAGEESGAVAGSLNIVATQMEKSYLLLKKVRGAMIYPAVIISAMVLLGVLLLIFMVPTLTATFSGLGVPLPLPTRILIGSSNFLIENTLLVLGGVVFLMISAVLFFKSRGGRRFFDRFFLKLPVVGTMVQEVQVARTARTLSSLLSAGVEIVAALEVTAQVLQNHLYKEALEHTYTKIQKGESLSVLFAQYENLYPVFVSEMATVGEETGKVSGMLMEVADYYERQVDQKTKDLSTIIEPVLMIVIGLGVGIFAISMLAPTYSLVDYI